MALAAVSADQILTAKVVPYATFSAGAVSGTSGAGVSATSAAYRPAASATTSHTHPWADVTGTPTTLADYGITDAASDAELTAHEADTTSVHGIADTSQLILEGDARLTDARTPTAHASTHASAGTDPIAPADIGAAAASHSHSAADVTSGTLATARGGTGVDGSAAANGALLIGNGTGFTAATLTAGSNVTITNGAGSITIASSGGGASGALTDLSDVTITTPSTGQVLKYNGTEWVNQAQGVFPFYKADGTSDTIALTGSTSNELPFNKADGTASNIPLVAS